MGQNLGPRMGLAGTTGITHETKPKCEIIQNGLVSGPSGTLKDGSSSKAVPKGTKAVPQPQAAEITEIALKMPIGPNATDAKKLLLPEIAAKSLNQAAERHRTPY